MIQISSSNVEKYFQIKYLQNMQDTSRLQNLRFRFNDKTYYVFFIDSIYYSNHKNCIAIILNNDNQSILFLVTTEYNKIIDSTSISAFGTFDYQNAIILDIYAINKMNNQFYWFIIFWLNMDFSAMSKLSNSHAIISKMKSDRIYFENYKYQTFLITDNIMIGNLIYQLSS